MVRILLWKYHKKKPWYRNLVSKAIVFFTGYPYTHVAIQVDGDVYESTVWKDRVTGVWVNGARRTAWLDYPDLDEAMPDEALCFVSEVNYDQKQRIIRVLEDTLDRKLKYNFLRLLALAFVYPTRWFWNLINWVPFKAEVFGEVCSTYVDEALKWAGIDLFKYQDEEYTAPGDYLNASSLRSCAL